MSLISYLAEDNEAIARNLIETLQEICDLRLRAGDDADFFVFFFEDRALFNVQAAFPLDKLKLLCHGLSLDGPPLRPAQVSWQNPEQLRFVLREGKKRQIRRMCEQVGLLVTGLKRVRIGQVNLGHLPVGQWRYLAPHEQF